MGSNPGIVSNSKISLGFGNPLEKQTFTNAAVHPAVMVSWEENVSLPGPLRQHRKLKHVRVVPFPMTSGVIVKLWEKVQLKSRLKNQHLYYFTFYFFSPLALLTSSPHSSSSLLSRTPPHFFSPLLRLTFCLLLLITASQPPPVPKHGEEQLFVFGEHFLVLVTVQWSHDDRNHW